MLFQIVALLFSHNVAMAQDDSIATELTTADDSVIEEVEEMPEWSVDYFSIFYGPSLGSPSSLQPTPYGKPDPNKPVLFKNYLTLGYHPTPDFIVSATAYWQLLPVKGPDLALKDPYLTIGRDHILNVDRFNLYADLRAHFPVTKASREANLLTSLQSFQIVTYEIRSSRLTVGTWGSIRYNLFGPYGYGNDLELYLGPNLSFQLSSNVALTLLYEMGANHAFGDPPFSLYNDGTDLEPGVVWYITPQLMLNPYVNLFTGGNLSWDSSAFGMTLNWKLL